MTDQHVRHTIGRHQGPLVSEWAGPAWHSESTLHQLSPYIGKTKSSMAEALVARYSPKGGVVYDPFSGCGTIAFEAWRAGRPVIANDLSPYAHLLSRAKLFPPRSLNAALNEITDVGVEARRGRDAIDLRHVPMWVRSFFHTETLRDTIAWVEVLRRRKSWFLLACLLGILHHQRPGFLSFPSSHTVPYLRVKLFPKAAYPELYEYRDLHTRLQAKVTRAFRRTPDLDRTVKRAVFFSSAARLSFKDKVDAIITSPPYMRQLDYGRDNRLRLWFLGVSDSDDLDQTISPRETPFLKLMAACFTRWKKLLKPGCHCVLVMGDASPRVNRDNLPSIVSRIATDVVGGYTHVFDATEVIPNERRVRRGIVGSASETILVLRHEPRRSRGKNP